nr:unnamed protein product [Haemonchus contortus]
MQKKPSRCETRVACGQSGNLPNFVSVERVFFEHENGRLSLKYDFHFFGSFPVPPVPTTAAELQQVPFTHYAVHSPALFPAMLNYLITNFVNISF